MSTVYLMHRHFVKIKIKGYKSIYKTAQPDTTGVTLLKALKSLWWSSILKDKEGPSTEITF